MMVGNNLLEKLNFDAELEGCIIRAPTVSKDSRVVQSGHIVVNTEM